MKLDGRRQSTNVHIQTDKEAAVADQAGKAQSVMRERLLNPESISTNKTDTKKEVQDKKTGMSNPARTLKAKDRPVDTNYPDAKFFKHTQEDNT